MFNIKDSYIAPIILSFVDKYIQDIRLEDTQVSLWSGEAVFHNLSLRLDVLEQELALPFTFVSGQIHNLVINVPWTKLQSEPITVTINTIECVLKLKGEASSSGDSSTSSIHDRKKAKIKRPEVETTPGYVQSLVNKIVSNITIQCNNLILKYVEEDIVLSLNVRSLSLQSANEAWEPAFSDLTIGQLIQRKLLSLHDLTVCLDRRSASGKIPFYEEPLLYRCSMEIRFSRTYTSMTASRASAMHVDVHCECMEFAASDQQIPLLLRILRLAMALYFNELKSELVGVASGMSDDMDEDSAESGSDDLDGSWMGWAWSFIPSILPNLLEEEEMELEQTCVPYVQKFGFYVDKITLTFKSQENAIDRSYCGSKKLKFHPILSLNITGSYFESKMVGVKQVSATMGCSMIELKPMGESCVCGTLDSRSVFLEMGKPCLNYMTNSLFDPQYVVDCVELKSWTDYSNEISESALLDKTPGLAIGYRYMLDVPDDLSEDELHEICSNVEKSNVPEKSTCIVVAGPVDVFICASLIHRLQQIQHAASMYNYQPYSQPVVISSLQDLPVIDEDALKLIEAYSPVRSYQLTIFKPHMCFDTMNHPYYDPSVLQRKKRTKIQPFTSDLPGIILNFQIMDVAFSRPMYPARVVKAASINKSESLLTKCMRTATINFFGANAQLRLDPTYDIPLLEKTDIIFSRKELVYSNLWQDSDVAHSEMSLTIDNLVAKCSSVHLSAARHAIRSYLEPSSLYRIVSNVFLFEGPVLEMNIKYLKLNSLDYHLHSSHRLTLKSLQAFVQEPKANKQYKICSSDEDLQFLSLVCQLRKTATDVVDKSPALIVNISQFDVCIDPVLLEWFKYSLQIEPVSSTHKERPMVKRSGSIETKSRSAPEESVHSHDFPSSYEMTAQVPTTKDVVPWSRRLLAYYKELQLTYVHINVDKTVIFVPTSSFSDATKPLKLSAEASEASMVILTLPSIDLVSSKIPKPNFDIPIILESVPVTPWSLTLKSFGCETIIGNSRKTILEPMEANCMIDLSWKSDDKDTIGVCLHFDTSLVKFNVSSEQINFIAQLAATVPYQRCYKKRHVKVTGFSTPPATVTAPSVQQQSTESQPECVPAPCVDQVKVSVWMQWTIARFLLSLYSRDQHNNTPLQLRCDFEEIMHMVESQNHYLKIKTKIATASVKHNIRNEEGTWVPGQHLGLILQSNDEASSIEASPDANHTAATRGLLEVIFTQALCKNVHEQWSKELNLSELNLAKNPIPRYISEVVVNLSPIDIILPSNLLCSYVSMFEPILAYPQGSSKSFGAQFNNNTLPLIYVDTKDVRVFVPLCASSNATTADVCVVQVKSIKLTHHVQNPLSRVFIEKDTKQHKIYKMARNATILNLPGSDVEDRQYQLDIVKLSVQSGVWEQVEKYFSRKSQELVSENPAVEWNKLEKDSPQDNDVALWSVLNNMNISFVAAPSIVYKQAGLSDILVCGHSFELNFTSEIDINLSVDQVHMVHNLLQEWLALLHNVQMCANSDPVRDLQSPLLDSGIDDCSSSINTQVMTAKPEVIPMELLITGRKINFTLYRVSQENIHEKKVADNVGYEASEESSSLENASPSPQTIVRPLLRVFILQPHVILVALPEKHKIEFSCYDMSLSASDNVYPVKTPSRLIPKSDSFNLHILETRLGDPHPKTGIPPSLLTVTLSDSEKCFGKLMIEVGRPFRLHVGASKRACMDKILQAFAISTCTGTSTSPNVLHKLLLVPSAMLHTQQIVVCSDSETCSLSVTNITGHLKSKTSIWSECNKLDANFEISGFMIKLANDIFVHPWDFSVNTTVSWFNKSPLIQTSICCESMRVDIGPDQVKCIQNIGKLLQPYIENYAKKADMVTQQVSDDIKCEVEHYKDDLRAGAFQFVQEEHFDLPAPYQILFSCTPLTMSWCYPQPRALSKVAATPLPYVPVADESSEEVTRLPCYLQYWSPCQNKFVTDNIFMLSETMEVDLNCVPLESKMKPNISCCWRILMGSEDPNDSVNESQPPVLPQILAGCLRVDSYVAPSLLPNYQIGVNIQYVEVNLICKTGSFQTKSETPIQDFYYDGDLPASLSLATLKLKSSNFQISQWQCGSLISEYETKVSLSVLDLSNLTNVKVIAPFNSRGRVFMKEENNDSHINLELFISDTSIKFGVSAGHLLMTAIQLWQSSWNNSTLLNFIPARLVFCNNLDESLRFRQVNTSEDITLPRQKFHIYAWKSFQQREKFQVAVVDTKWEWSEPFAVDVDGAKVINFMHKNIRLICVIKSISNTQKMITISGQLIIHNELKEVLEFQLISLPNCKLPTCDRYRSVISVPGQSKSSSFVLKLDKELNVLIRYKWSPHWSGPVPLTKKDCSSIPWLVKVPCQEKNVFVSSYCRTLIRSLDTCNRYTLIVSAAFSICSLFPTPKKLLISTIGLDTKTPIVIEGQGKTQQLYCPGALKHAHKVIFTSNDGTELGDLPLTHAVAVRSPEQDEWLQKLDIDSPTERVELEWPYVGHQTCVPESEVWTTNSEFDIRRITVTYKHELPYHNTLQMQILPYILIVNVLDRDVYVVVNGEQQIVPHHGVIVPAQFQGLFRLSLGGTDLEFLSAPLEFATEEWNKNYYRPQISGMIPTEGMVHNIIPAIDDNVLLAVVSSQKLEDYTMRVLTIKPTIFLSCEETLGSKLSISAVCVPALSLSTPLPSQDLDTFSAGKVQPILIWKYINDVEDTQMKFIDDLNFYLLIRCSEQDWARPVLISPPRSHEMKGCDTRQCICVGGEALVVTTHCRDGQLYVVVNRNPYPQLVLHNLTQHTLVCAESKTGINGVEAVPEGPNFSWFCTINPGQVSTYTMPSIQTAFPCCNAKVSKQPVPNLMLALKSEYIEWSEPFSVGCLSEQFLSLEGNNDVVLRMSNGKNGSTVILIECASRIEISAKEIRSRLQPGSQVQTNLETNEEQVKPVAPAVCAKAKPKTIWNVSVYATQLELAVMEDKHLRSDGKLLLTLNFVCACVKTNDNCREFKLAFGDMQLDNQMVYDGGYDFPVILTKQEALSMPNLLLEFCNMKAIMEEVPKEALMMLQFTQDLNSIGEATNTSLRVSLKPISLYIEDAFVISASKLMQDLTPSNLAYHKNSTAFDPFVLPQDVSLEAHVAASPLQLQKLVIDPISVQMSLHTSVKVFIALDRSQLSFSAFERQRLCTTSYVLGQDVTRHYLSGALFSAGWVVGSLELLGSPSVFAVTVGSGIRDFVCLPYLGILQGPWEFLAGITNGSASLMKHVTAGTLSSITNLASSMARNLDRCSLDKEHVERAEEARRQRPQGVAEGMMQGLTSFGISLLGAVGGIAHHPLQALVNNSYGTSPLSGLVAGVGLGIVGAITKPLSGAAELVALTGQGLLQGAGWSRDPCPRGGRVSEWYSSRSMSSSHFEWKPTSRGEGPVLLCTNAVLEATQQHFTANVVLVITNQVFLLTAPYGDGIMHISVPLDQVRAEPVSSDSSLLCITQNRPRQFQKLHEYPHWRVEDFVRDSVPAAAPAEEPTSSCPSHNTNSIHVHVNPYLRQHIIKLLHITQCHLQSRGFLVLWNRSLPVEHRIDECENVLSSASFSSSSPSLVASNERLNWLDVDYL